MMTTDQKIDEVLKSVREQGERNDLRFVRNEEKIDEVLKIVREQGQELRAEVSALREVFVEERKLNNDRFTQVATGLLDVRQEVKQLRVDLNAKIDRVNESLSADINAFATDLYETKRRFGRSGKKLPS